MNQPSLFDQAPISRRTDPATSHEGAGHIEPQLGNLQAAMLTAITLYGSRGITAQEAAQACIKYQGFPDRKRESLRKRIGELAAMGRIVAGEARTCNVTKCSATTWRVAQ